MSMRSFSTCSVFALALAASACSASPSSSGAEDSAAEAIRQESAALDAPASPDDWCSHVTAGARTTKSPLFALSAAHAGVRFFGSSATLTVKDRALAKALAKPLATDGSTLRDYVTALGDGQQCVRHASPATLGPASVRLVGDVAVVRPGTGVPALPAGARAVAIDLRDLPNVPFSILNPGNGLASDPVRDALDAAASLALATPVQRPLLQFRDWFDMANSDIAWGDVGLSQQVEAGQLEPIPAASRTELPLAVLTGREMSPAAAELAGALRLANRAWILGADVYSAAAESNWSGVAEDGLVWRELDALDVVSNQRWPDIVPADARGGDPLALIAGLASRGNPPARAQGPDARLRVAPIANLFEPQPTTLGAGEARAGLLTIHGALRIFDRNFGDVGDFIDGRLQETLAEVDVAALAHPHSPIDRDLYLTVLRRFGEAAHDGHNFVTDEAKPFTGFIPLKIEQIEGRPVVRRSEIAGIVPGDAIVTIDGLAADLWYAAQKPLTSASTDSYRFNQITRKRLLRVYGPRTFVVASPNGQKRTVIAQPKPFAYEGPFGAAFVERPSGFLSDLGAPDVYFLNMSYDQTPDEDAGIAAVAAGAGARAMIVDMRGYPHGFHYVVDQALIPPTFLSPTFVDGLALSPNTDDMLIFSSPFPVDFGQPTLYTGPLVLLVGTDTASAAENFALMLVDAGRAQHVVGRTTAGTNGTITGLEVLGHYTFDFTGEGLRHADGSKFIGVGIVPDVPVTLTAAAVANGGDPELTAALASLAH